MAGTQVIDMTGKRFQRLLVLCRAGTSNATRRGPVFVTAGPKPL